MPAEPGLITNQGQTRFERVQAILDGAAEVATVASAGRALVIDTSCVSRSCKSISVARTRGSA